jgi:protein-tyrosine phosphatase
MNFLFVCSKNRWRSLTAETIFKNKEGHVVRSAGTANDARVRITESLINWADLIFVMEKKHKLILEKRFEQSVQNKKIIVLHIEDNYEYMDDELVEMLKAEAELYL